MRAVVNLNERNLSVLNRVIYTHMSKCTICFIEHNNTWKDGTTNMYCHICEPIRNAARGTISEILDTLYLADMQAASKFDGHRLCVHEMGPTYKGQCHFAPILSQRPHSSLDRTGAVVDMTMLNYAAGIIDAYVKRGEKLLVHCQGGVERSPLTVAWYLIKSKRVENFQQAYAFLKSKRPVVSERTFWLPEDFSMV